ncbi:hypothetical protein [Rubritalea tangerina]|uniref:hypothetical protein n=1 Tax=Rubritalea tangerina TaxID=430798 RepID=UPI00361A6A9C
MPSTATLSKRATNKVSHSNNTPKPINKIPPRFVPSCATSVSSLRTASNSNSIKMNDHELHHLILKLIEDEITPAEFESLQDALRSDPHALEIYQELITLEQLLIKRNSISLPSLSKSEPHPQSVKKTL